MKKNTLLYLEKHLVQKAKNKHLNISEIAENALKQALNEHRDIHDPEYIYETAEKTLLPYTIKKIQIKKYALFKNKTFDFKKTNLIVGPNASGKTLLLKALQGITQNTEDKVTIEISSKKTKTLNKDFTECILLDMPFARYTKKTIKKALLWLKNKNLQLIITSLEELKGFDGIIKLKRLNIKEDYERIKELD